jgi:hypothetical protein
MRSKMKKTFFKKTSKTLRICFYSIFFLFLIGCGAKKLPITQADRDMQVWRQKEGIRQVPANWGKWLAQNKTTIYWEPSSGVFEGFRGYSRKEINPGGPHGDPVETFSETDIFRSGKQVKMRDPDHNGALMDETLYLRYYVNNGVIIRRQVFLTSTKQLDDYVGDDFERAVRLAEEWCLSSGT